MVYLKQKNKVEQEYITLLKYVKKTITSNASKSLWSGLFDEKYYLEPCKQLINREDIYEEKLLTRY